MMRTTIVLLVGVAFVACGKQEAGTDSDSPHDYRALALEFVTALAARDYSSAYAKTSNEFKQSMSVNELRLVFETIVPLDWEFGAIEVTEQTLSSWPTKQPADVGWAYVSIGGDVYSEAVTVVVTLEDGTLRIRKAEFGRP